VLEAEQRVEVHLRVVRAGLFVAEALVERVRIFLKRPRGGGGDHERPLTSRPGSAPVGSSCSSTISPETIVARYPSARRMKRFPPAGRSEIHSGAPRRRPGR